MNDAPQFIKAIAQRYSAGVFLLFLPKAFAVVVALATFPIILANLAVEEYGIFQFVLAVEFWLTSSAAFNTIAGAKRGIVKGLDGTFLLAFLFRLKILIVLSIGVFLAAFVVFQLGMATLAALLGIVAVYIVLGHSPYTSYPEFLIAKKSFKAYAAWQTLVLMSVPVFSMVVAILTRDIILFTLVYLGVQTILGWAGMLYVMARYNVLSSFQQGEIDKECVPFGVKLVPAQIVSNTATRVSEFLIGLFFGFANLAVFAVARNLERYSRTPVKILHNLLYADFAQHDGALLARRVLWRLPLIFVFSAGAAALLALTGHLYISLFLPSSYEQASMYFFLLLLAFPAETMQVFLNTILDANLRHRELSFLIVIPSLLRILFIVLLGLLFGIVGIALGIVAGAWAGFLFHYFVVMRFKNVPSV